MKLSDFEKERELQKDLQNLLEGKVTFSKSELLDYLKKETPEVEEEQVEEISEEDSEEVSFKELVDDPIEEIPETNEESVIEEPNETQETPVVSRMDRLLDEVETPSEPTVAPKAGTFLVAGGGGENNAGTNVGNGVEIFKGIGTNGGSPLQLRTLSASGSASVIQVGDLIVIGASVSADNDSWPSVSADYYTSTQVNSISSTLYSELSADNDSWPLVSASYYTASQTNNLLSNKADLSAVSGDNDTWPTVSASYYTSNQTNNLLSNKADLSAVSGDNDTWQNVSANYYTSTQTNNLVSSVSSTLYSTLSGDRDSWVSVSANYYTKTETVNLSDVDGTTPKNGYVLGYNASSAFWDPTNILNTSGGFSFGTSANNTSFAEDTGYLSATGSACAWDDLRVAGSSVGVGASAPDLVTMVGGGLLVRGFDGNATLEQVYFEIQMPHAWKIGSTISPHVHWTPTTTASGGVVWFLEYTWANINGIFSASTTISGLQSATNEQWKHKLCEFPDIVPPASISGVSSMIVCRLYRSPTVTQDTYPNDAGLLEFDIHYQIDSFGSRDEYSK